MNRSLFGFVWRQIPVVSQFKLEKGYKDDDRFPEWSMGVIDDYEYRCRKAASDCDEAVRLLRSKGCSDVVVSPDAVGAVRLVLFDRFLAELPEETFVMVVSWGDFGTETTILDCMDRALARKVYLITEQHISLLHVPVDHLEEAYKGLVRAQITGGYRVSRTMEDELADLLIEGKSKGEIMDALGISRATYYRIATRTLRRLRDAMVKDTDSIFTNERMADVLVDKVSGGT